MTLRLARERTAASAGDIASQGASLFSHGRAGHKLCIVATRAIPRAKRLPDAAIACDRLSKP